MIKKLAILFFSLTTVLSLWTCTKRMICPAFQSAFIYDEEVLRKKFSYFNADSVPKKLMASKTKYLIITPKSYKRRMQALQTVEMKKIYPVLDSLQTGLPKKDSVSMQQDSLLGEYVASASDSLATDSTSLNGLASLTTIDSSYYEITLEKEKYNTDQDNYMWYLRDILVLPDARIALSAEQYAREQSDSLAHRKKKKSSKKLLRRRKKTDSTAVVEPTKLDTTDVQGTSSN